MLYRVYLGGQEDNSHKITSVSLLDLYPNKLYSLEQYQKVLEIIAQEFPSLITYTHNHTLYIFGDHPTFFLLRKLLAQNNLPIPVISKLGPFHIWLNLVTDTAIYFFHIYSLLYNTLFGSKLGSKPKFSTLNYLNHQMYIAWSAIKEDVLAKFKLSKDPEVQSWLFFFEEVLPLCVLTYSVVFRSGNIDSWIKTLGRIQLLFINWGRKR